MKCPHCGSQQIRKNGHRRSKQNYRCKQCDRQFVEFYSPRGYSDDVKQICLRMRRLGVGLREIERFTGVSHNTLIQWMKQAGGVSEEVDSDERLDSARLDSAKLDSAKPDKLSPVMAASIAGTVSS